MLVMLWVNSPLTQGNEACFIYCTNVHVLETYVRCRCAILQKSGVSQIFFFFFKLILLFSKDTLH